MNEGRYIISDASKRLRIEPHVLRYWEDELELNISRNELGHRYYTEEDLVLLENVKDLKEQGFQLKAIKILMLNDKNNMDSNSEENHINTNIITNDFNDITIHNIENEKMLKFQSLMKEIFSDTLKENNYKLTESVSENIIKQMDYLLRIKDEREEERFKKFDESIREMQKTRQEVATTKSNKLKIFRKKR